MRRAIIAGATAIRVITMAQAPAIAQEPTEEQKKAALMEAYRLNGNSMVGWGSIDVSKPDALSDEAITCVMREGASTGAIYFDCPQPTRHIRIIPTKKNGAQK